MITAMIFIVIVTIVFGHTAVFVFYHHRCLANLVGLGVVPHGVHVCDDIFQESGCCCRYCARRGIE